MHRPHEAREIADVLACIGEHALAAEISAAVLASIADVPEQRGRRRHARTIEVAHAIEAAIDRGDVSASLTLVAALPADEPSPSRWGFEDLPFDVPEPDPLQDVAGRVRLRGASVEALASLAGGASLDLADLAAENRRLFGADREGGATWAFVELLEALEHANQWRPARRRAEKDADRFREAARDRAREVRAKQGTWSWPVALEAAVSELEALEDPMTGVQRAAAALARCPVPFASTSVLIEPEPATGRREESAPDRVVILGLTLDGAPVTTLDQVPRNTLLRLEATTKVTGGWPEDAKALRISFVSDISQRDLERGEIVIERGLSDGGTQVNLRANVPADHPVEMAAAASFEGGSSPVAPRLLGATRLRLTTAAATSPVDSGSPTRPAEAEEGSGIQSSPRRRGRPKGTRSVTRAEIVEKFRALRVNYGRNPTQAELAANLTPRIEVRTLMDHLTDYGLGWPIE